VRGDFNARGTVAKHDGVGHVTLFGVGADPGRVDLKTPTVYDRDRKNDSLVINAQKLKPARDKLEKIKERFKTWIWEDDERRDRLCRKYNDEFNSVRLRVFNGSHLTLPSSSNRSRCTASKECSLANHSERQHAARARRRCRQDLHDGRQPRSS